MGHIKDGGPLRNNIGCINQLIRETRERNHVKTISRQDYSRIIILVLEIMNICEVFNVDVIIVIGLIKRDVKWFLHFC